MQIWQIAALAITAPIIGAAAFATANPTGFAALVAALLS